ncbi:hypothetical protein D3C76_1426690 [compost metagenome]
MLKIEPFETTKKDVSGTESLLLIAWIEFVSAFVRMLTTIAFFRPDSVFPGSNNIYEHTFAGCVASSTDASMGRPR